MKETFNSIIAVFLTAITYYLGGWDKVIIILVTFMALDYLTGVMAAVYSKSLSSDIGYKGLLRKATIIIILVVAVLLDRLLNEGTWVFRTLVAYFYIANEGISLMENGAKLGLPLPPKIIEILQQLKNKEGGQVDNTSN